MEELKKMAELKKSLMESVEVYHAAALRLEFERKKILDLKHKLNLDTVKCPVCGTVNDYRMPFCSKCRWHFSPIEGIPQAGYLLNNSEEEITAHRRIFDRTSDTEEMESLKNRLATLKKALDDSKEEIKRLKADKNKSNSSQTSSSGIRETAVVNESSDGKFEVRVLYADFVMTPLLQSWGIRSSHCPNGYYEGTLAIFSDIERAQSLKSQLENYGAKVRVWHNGKFLK